MSAVPATRAHVSPGALAASLEPGLRFKLGRRTLALVSCVVLWRRAESDGRRAWLVLTPDWRLALVEQAVAPDLALAGIATRVPGRAVELDGPEAARLLEAHGEGDLVEEFPELFQPHGTHALPEKHAV